MTPLPAEHHKAPSVGQAAGPDSSGTALPVHDAGSLTSPAGLACILLDGRRYLLRITRSRKLLLTRADLP